MSDFTLIEKVADRIYPTHLTEVRTDSSFSWATVLPAVAKKDIGDRSESHIQKSDRGNHTLTHRLKGGGILEFNMSPHGKQHIAVVKYQNKGKIYSAIHSHKDPHEAASTAYMSVKRRMVTEEVDPILIEKVAKRIEKKTGKLSDKKEKIDVNPVDTDTIKEDQLNEVATGNPGYGFHGELGKHFGTANADNMYKVIHHKLKKHLGEAGLLSDVKKPDKTLKDYLDSARGRHLYGLRNDMKYLHKDFKAFKKHYDPDDYIEESLNKAHKWALKDQTREEGDGVYKVQSPKYSTHAIVYAKDKKDAHTKAMMLHGSAYETTNVKIRKLDEATPPGMESWVKKNKATFVKEYGEKKGHEVLYATAWKLHDKLHEAYDDSPQGILAQKDYHHSRENYHRQAAENNHNKAFKYAMGSPNHKLFKDAAAAHEAIANHHYKAIQGLHIKSVHESEKPVEMMYLSKGFVSPRLAHTLASESKFLGTDSSTKESHYVHPRHGRFALVPHKSGEYQFRLAEEVESLNELSPTTLGSYIHLASIDGRAKNYMAGSRHAVARMAGKDGKPDEHYMKQGDKDQEGSAKRHKGIVLATRKLVHKALVKEDTIDENAYHDAAKATDTHHLELIRFRMAHPFKERTTEQHKKYKEMEAKLDQLKDVERAHYMKHGGKEIAKHLLGPGK